jgi:uncharacterized membrane protein
VSFATPWALTGLLLLVPLILLHLRNRREERRDVSSLLLWHEFGLDSASGQRSMRRPPLPLFLLLEALVLILLVGALAGTRIDSGAPRPATVVVVDGSHYMQLPGRIADAQKAIRSIGGTGQVRLILAGTNPSVVYRGSTKGAASALTRIDGGATSPQAATTDMATALQTATGLLTGPHDRVVMIRAAEDPAPQAQASPGELRDVVVGTRVSDLAIASAGANCALSDTSSCEITATIENTGTGAATARLDASSSGGQALTQSTVVPAGGEAASSFLSHASQSVALRLLDGGKLAANDIDTINVPGAQNIPRTSKVALIGTPKDALGLARAFAAVPGVSLQLRTPKSYVASQVHNADLVIFDGWLPKHLPPVSAEMLVDTPRIPGGHVGQGQSDSTVSGSDAASPLLDGGVDLSSLSLSPGAATTVTLPRWLSPVVWSPSGPLLAAGDNGPMRLIVMPFEPGKSNISQLQALPLLAVNVVRWSLGYQPARGPPTPVNIRDAQLQALRSAPYALAPWLLGGALALLLLEAGCWYYPPARRPRLIARELLAPAPIFGLTAAVLLIVTLAAPDLHVGSARTTVLAVDRSGSVSKQAVTVERRFTKHLSSSRCVSPCAPVRFGSSTQTDLQQAISGALAITPNGGQLAVLSDGGQTNGDALSTAKLARARGVRIDWVKLAGRSPDASITSISTPSQVRVGDTIPLSLTVHTTAIATVTLSITHDGSPATSERIRMKRGDNPLLLLYKASTRGWHSFQARVSILGDTDPINDTAATTVHVGPEPQVLVVSSTGSSPMSGILAPQQLAINEATPAALPTTASGYSRYATIVLDDVPTTAMSTAQVTALDAAVQTGGAGLVVLGGNHSFSLGRYWQSPIQKILPVTSLVPGKLERRNLAVELVLDHSGSMSDYAGGVPKIKLTRVAAQQSAKFLAHHRDQLGVIDFDIVPHILWPLKTVSPGASLKKVDKLVSALQADGGTDIYLALQRGYQELLKSHIKQRHMILMTDGISAGGHYAQLLQKIRAAKITVATIALGSDADRLLLKQIAEATGGHAYATDNANNLPKILVKETQLSAKPVRDIGKLAVAVSSDSPVVRSLSGKTLPTLAGNVVVKPKTGAQTDLTATGQNGQTNPALAQWQVGAGRVVVWTPGVSSSWGSSWQSERTVWDDAVRWAQRGPAAPALTPTPTPGVSGSLQIDLASLGTKAAGVQGATGTLRAAGGHLYPVNFTLTAPGLLRADVDGLPAGIYSFRLVATGSSSTSTSGSGSAFDTTGELTFPYPSEASPVQAFTSPMGQLVTQTGGAFVSANDPTALDGSRYDLRAPLVILALIAFLINVLARIAPGELRRLRSTRPGTRRVRAAAARPAGPRR